MRLGLILLLAGIATVFAAEESCMDRCENGFDSKKDCQCDTMCRYYKSCCSDYETACHMKARGDTFEFAEDDDGPFTPTTPAFPTQPEDGESSSSGGQHRQPTRLRTPNTTPTPAKIGTKITPVTEPARGAARGPQRGQVPVVVPLPEAAKATKAPSATQTGRGSDRGQFPVVVPVPETAIATEATSIPQTTTEEVVTTTKAPVVDPDAQPCSSRPWDSLMQLKNGSVYAFRGEWFFELDEKSVMPGYPKLIQDIWGIRGPIDAAFTRINCQGKTYMFKGNKYWRFDDGVLEEDYPRDINVGFEKIPDDVDAAFAIAAPGHHGKEKVYFFKGDQYYQYEFKHQPSHEECIKMSAGSPSALFTAYTDIYHNNWEELFNMLFRGIPNHHGGHRFINKDWIGIKAPVDAVMTGRLYINPRSLAPPLFPPLPPLRDHNDGRRQPWDQQWGQYGQQDQLNGQQNGQQYGQQGQQYGQQWEQQWGRRRNRRQSYWGAGTGMAMGQAFAEKGMDMGKGFAEKGMDLGRKLAERGMAMEGMFGGWDMRRTDARDEDRDRDRRRDDQDRRRDDQDRRGDGYNYDSRYNAEGRAYWEFVNKGQPVQSVYFFKGDKYYRVDLKTKKVDPASPPYPRSIGKYWLGCPEKHLEAEKK
ncbi:vitronectin-like [Salvelinus namaycush]|uniref:Vitronectin-like n=1 Tax=Salvelinus namaycush TaxID=8040 RepID=A0A8U0P326_SALNM|nr:vitronectin-like [Salvelinus namaycush]